MARYALGTFLVGRTWEAWWAIMMVNLSGALLLGIVVGAVGDSFNPHPAIRIGLTVGVLGGYTTLSTLMVESAELAGMGRFTAALLNITVSVVAGLLAAVGGLAIGRAL